MLLKKFLIIISGLIMTFTVVFLWKKNTTKDIIEIKQKVTSNKENSSKDKKEIRVISNHYNTSDSEKNVTTNEEIIPSSVEQAADEKSFVEKKLIDENAVSRLNANILSLAEREKYLIIYKRLSFLDKYILDSKIKVISDNLKKIEDHHEERLRQFGIEH
jgi:uncharacterized membrane protein YgaE (UPF0421/DUF939 family)